MKVTRKTKEAMWGYLFALPWFIGLSIFFFYPFIGNFFYSFTEYNIIQSPKWTGIENYRILMHDPSFWKSLYNTIYYMVLSVPSVLIISLLIACLLNQKIKGVRSFRTIFYLPTIVPIIASCILWKWILNPEYGLINSLLFKLGINGPPWLASENWSKPSLILMSTWIIGEPVIIFLAALQGIPKVLYEVAAIDGANTIKKFSHVTIPLLTPVILFNLIMAIIRSFQYLTFTQAYTMTAGGPVESTLFYILYLYRNAFDLFKMGKASAMAVILFGITLIITLYLVKTSSRWVYYERESRK